MPRDPLPEIRISDPYIKEIVAEVQKRRHGDGGTASKTAGQMILERYTQLESEKARPGRREKATA